MRLRTHYVRDYTRILYALPGWGGFLTADLIGKINAHVYGWVTMAIWNCSLNCFSMRTLNSIKVKDIALIVYILALSSCEIFPHETALLSLCFPSRLPLCQYELYKRSFVLRILSDEAYWLYLLYFYIIATYCSFISCFYVSVLRLLYTWAHCVTLISGLLP